MYAIFGQNKYVLAFIENTHFITETAITLAEERKEWKEQNLIWNAHFDQQSSTLRHYNKEDSNFIWCGR